MGFIICVYNSKLHNNIKMALGKDDQPNHTSNLLDILRVIDMN